VGEKKGGKRIQYNLHFRGDQAGEKRWKDSDQKRKKRGGGGGRNLDSLFSLLDLHALAVVTWGEAEKKKNLKENRTPEERRGKIPSLSDRQKKKKRKNLGRGGKRGTRLPYRSVNLRGGKNVRGIMVGGRKKRKGERKQDLASFYFPALSRGERGGKRFRQSKKKKREGKRGKTYCCN